ncbi:MAG: hypothetical protein HYW25_02365 [Candidatus Aenigmarchaeota archaeon]|nr:hypothetical protein [Candidatus Aenigmarchaeota archaeon]
MPPKKLSDMVFHRVSPPDDAASLSAQDLAKVIVRRLGLKRKESRADHAALLLALFKYRRDNLPVDISKMAELLQVSQSQAYEEIRKWKSLGLIEFVKLPAGESGFIKGYMLPAPTMNRLLDKVEASMKAFLRKTRRIAKDFDDIVMLGTARQGKEMKEETKESEVREEKNEETREE